MLTSLVVIIQLRRQSLIEKKRKGILKKITERHLAGEDRGDYPL